MSIDADLDHLYQLPPSAFIAERNALAKRSGTRGGDIRALPKPTLPVWVVNQLHWRHPEIYRSLIDSAENLRATHKAVLGGRRGDLRAASRTHEEALDAALKAALAIAAEGGSPPSDAVRQTIGTTLRALPGADPPGRLRQALMPGGFETLTGLPAGGRVVPPSAAGRPQKAAAPKHGAPTAAPRNKPDRAALARARKVAADAAKALNSADQASRREEFEAARAARDADAAQRRVSQAREAVEAAQAELEQAEEDAAAAAKKRDAARTRAASADKALATARGRADAAQRELRQAEAG
jgi:hypothetical protein